MNNIKYIKGNIFETKCSTIINPVNCVGNTNCGIIMSTKREWRNMYDIYKDFCKRELIYKGKLWLYKPKKGKWVLNFPVKDKWEDSIDYTYIQQGLQKFRKTYKEKEISSAAFPLFGNRNKNIDNNKMLNIMMSNLRECNIPIEIYEEEVLGPGRLIPLLEKLCGEINEKSKNEILTVLFNNIQ